MPRHSGLSVSSPRPTAAALTVHTSPAGQGPPGADLHECCTLAKVPKLLSHSKLVASREEVPGSHWPPN